MGIKALLSKLFEKIAEPASVVEVEALRERFKQRYLHFTLLLIANNKALDSMAELEMALQGNECLDMGFIRSRTTRISTNVFQIIRHLERIAPGKYDNLLPRFHEIKDRLNNTLSPIVAPTDAPLVVPLALAGMEDAHLVGRKMASIGEVGQYAGITIPRGFAVTTEGYHRFMAEGGLKEEIGRIIQTSNAHRTGELLALSRRIESCVLNATLPTELARAIQSSVDELTGVRDDVEMAFRSSAIGEDEPCLSFAGMYCSCLHITRKNALETYKRVVAGTYSPQAINYRWNMGIRDIDVSMSVGVMPMVDAIKGGVAYTRNPLKRNEDTVIIEAAPGLPVTVVNGDGTDRVAISRKAPYYVVRREGEEQASEGVLSDREAAHIASLILRIEDHLRVPQDIEWAMDAEGTVIILQARPLAGREAQDDVEMPPSEPPPVASSIVAGGVAVCAGTASGSVFIATNEADMIDCPDNDAVLVLTHPLPAYATVIHRVRAVVSERGGIAGHLASVCRQFDVPSLFSIKGAASMFRNGQVVTVDADRQQILEGHVARVAGRPRPEVVFQGTRVFQALEAVAAQIIPLNLLDPDATDFRVSSCRTYHDITRFCHEKVVREMFEFGVSEPFPGHASKQLLLDHPMQFWLIDLDDGFELANPDSQYVCLDEIRSIPMLALWRGMTAVPWKGPPPVNTKGFMEVLFGSTSDPSLVPSMPSGYAVRNFFMVSRHFMSLQSRFGYHFSTVEAVVGNRALENYVSFNFKGGAAGLERRTRRAKMIEAVLIDKGFRVKRYGDGVRARVEGFDQAQMDSRIAMLGFLLMHTRQLDMAMSDEASVQKHKAIILDELRSLEARSQLSRNP